MQIKRVTENVDGADNLGTNTIDKLQKTRIE